MIIALLASAHLYVLPWKLLFLLPAGSEKPCAITSLRFGSADGKWERGSNFPASACTFRVSVEPGGLLPAWADSAPAEGDLEVTFTVQGSDKPQSLTLKPEKVEAAAAKGAELSASAKKVHDRVRVEVKNRAAGPLVLGDAVALRDRPKDDCVGPGPAAVVQPGETLVDVRPGLLSPSMKIWVAAFTGEKRCKWVEVRRAP